MTFLLALLSGIVGAIVGGFVGLAAAGVLAPFLGITSFEGASGYFAVFICAPIGALVGLIASVLLALRLRGVRSGGAIAGRFGLIVLVIAGLVAAGLAYMYFDRDLVTTDGPPPKLAFEIRLPPGAALPAPAAITVHLDSTKGHVPASIDPEKLRRDSDRPVIVGSVEIVYRESNRLLVLRLPDQPDQIFSLRLGKDPGHAKDLGGWQRVDYVADQGQNAPRRATPNDSYEIRYRTVWVGED